MEKAPRGNVAELCELLTRVRKRMGTLGGVSASACALGLALALAACQRERRDVPPVPSAETGPQAVTVSDLYPGPVGPPPADPRGRAYEGNAFHISNGQRYYKWFNCNGCHFNGGGGIGPALMDQKWRYGGRIEQVYASIYQGRPNGMPAFKDKIPEAQIWEIAAYVRSLSGQADKLAASSRQDAMRSTPPVNNTDAQPQTGDPAATKTGGG
jgi:cytochrome c oxidase cbb3-type subunit 3